MRWVTSHAISAVKSETAHIVTSLFAAQDHASLQMYEAQSAPGGSKPGASLGSITFQFNPKEVTISKSAQWAKDPVKSAPTAGPPEYNGADPCKLTLEMFFDSTLKSDHSVVDSVEKLFSHSVVDSVEKLFSHSVVDSVEKLFSCCVPLDKTCTTNKPMPPLVVFKWGGITSFPAYVTQVNAKYTRFASNGIPIRAVCTVNLEEMPSEPGQQNPTSGVLAVERVHTMIAGDNLALVAYQEYGDPAMWRPLAAYNRVDDPLRIANGTQILLPAAETLLASGR